MRHFSAFLLISALGCGGGTPSWNQTEIGTTARNFSSNVQGTPAGGAGSGLGDRLGPGTFPTDCVSPVSAPVKSGAKIMTLPGLSSHGPEVVVGSTAVYVDTSAHATVAINLETQTELWRLATGSFEPRFVMTDGTALCGFGAQPANNYASATIQCVTLATGVQMWTKQVPRWLTNTADYGPPGYLAIRNGTLYVLGGGELDAYVLADGTELWHQSAVALHRSIHFVGSDLVIESADVGCLAGAAHCVRALDPATGATLAEHPSAGSFLWSTESTAAFLAGTDKTRTVVTYDATTRIFAEDAALGTSLMTSLLGERYVTVVGGLSEPASAGPVWLAAIAPGGGATSLCRFTVASQKLDACQRLPYKPDQLRIHPNAIFLAQGQRTSVVLPDSGPGVQDFRFYYGRWGFNFGDVYASR